LIICQDIHTQVYTLPMPVNIHFIYNKICTK